ncbi:MAG: SpoIIE family protein phosphatase, partial [Bacteroidota bacterium]
STWLTLRIEYGSLYIGPIFILLFFNSMYPRELPRWVVKVMLVPTLLLGIALLIPNSFWFSILLPAGQVVMLISGLTVIAYTLPLAIYRKRKSAWLFTIAFLSLFGTAVNDMLYALNLVDTGFIILYGMLFFTFVQAIALAVRFGFTFQQLNMLRMDLEKKVEKRTADITLKNQELEQQKEELTSQTEEMTANLEYARRIQEASLDSVDYIRSLFPEAFVLYFPRDYVSGDFYWFGEIEGKKVVIGGDCTGHGVPGAFMTALGQAALDQIILGEGIVDPGEILTRLEERVKATMQSQVDGKWLPDGMDIGVLVFDEKSGNLAFEGAKIDLVFIRDHEITRVRGSKFPIGRTAGYGHKTFQTSIHPFQKGDRFYVYSDGYRDQFGGPEGRKFNAKPFRELLEQTAGGSLAHQYRELSKSFEDWKGNHPQTDDILVLGLEV